MSKRQKRQQKPKDTGNRAMYDAMMELRSSSAAEPHRNRSRYSRNDWRRKAQAGKWDE